MEKETLGIGFRVVRILLYHLNPAPLCFHRRHGGSLGGGRLGCGSRSAAVPAGKGRSQQG